MKIRNLLVILLACLSVTICQATAGQMDVTTAAPFALVGCANPPPAKTVVQDVLTSAQIACVFLQALTNAPEVATACGIDSKMTPLVEQLIGQREAAKKSGVQFKAPPAGSP